MMTITKMMITSTPMMVPIIPLFMVSLLSSLFWGPAGPCRAAHPDVLAENVLNSPMIGTFYFVNHTQFTT
jgi:hypothetical protein